MIIDSEYYIQELEQWQVYADYMPLYHYFNIFTHCNQHFYTYIIYTCNTHENMEAHVDLNSYIHSHRMLWPGSHLIAYRRDERQKERFKDAKASKREDT